MKAEEREEEMGRERNIYEKRGRERKKEGNKARFEKKTDSEKQLKTAPTKVTFNNKSCRRQRNGEHVT
jgi:hypothetical protein